MKKLSLRIVVLGNLVVSVFVYVDVLYARFMEIETQSKLAALVIKYITIWMPSVITFMQTINFQGGLRSITLLCFHLLCVVLLLINSTFWKYIYILTETRRRLGYRVSTRRTQNFNRNQPMYRNSTSTSRRTGTVQQEKTLFFSQFVVFCVILLAIINGIGILQNLALSLQVIETML
jgi:hypothetical protein